MTAPDPTRPTGTPSRTAPSSAHLPSGRPGNKNISAPLFSALPEVPQGARPVRNPPLCLASRADPIDGSVGSDLWRNGRLLALEAGRRRHAGSTAVGDMSNGGGVELRHDLGRPPLGLDCALLIEEVGEISDVHDGLVTSGFGFDHTHRTRLVRHVRLGLTVVIASSPLDQPGGPPSA